MGRRRFITEKKEEIDTEQGAGKGGDRYGEGREEIDTEKGREEIDTEEGLKRNRRGREKIDMKTEETEEIVKLKEIQRSGVEEDTEEWS